MPAATMNTKDMSDMAIVQPTEQPRTSPPPFAASHSYYESHRVSWAELREDLHRRKVFRRTVQKSKEKFVKFTHLLSPLLQTNER